MTALTNQIRFQIADKRAGSLNFLALLRWALVIIFLWFGRMTFATYEAAGIAPFIEQSPIMSWLHVLFGVRKASYFIGVIELSTAAALILGAFQPIFSALGAAMSAATYLITLTFFLVASGFAIPTLVITAFPDESVRQRALQAGIICYLIKSFPADDFVDFIRLALRLTKPTRTD
jgi:uncharacterized membrane protein YkgB